jgi:aminoglycoside/choline kinase family phosphotransferase
LKPEESERLLITELFENSKQRVEALKDHEISDVVKLTGDASTRRYYRINTNQTSFVSCLTDAKENIESSDFLNVQKVLGENKVRVPRIIDQNIKKGYMLQEDLGNITFLSHIATKLTKDEIYNEYERVIDSLIEIHKVPKDKDYNWGTLEFDVEKYIFEMNFTKKYFINKFLKVELSKQEEKDLDEDLLKLVSEIASMEKVLSHRDFHSRNIMVKDGEFIYIDFQDARQGIPQYDLVSLLEDCYFQLETSNVEKLKTYYFDNYIKKFSTDQKNLETFMRMYDLMTIQRVFKAIGSFSYIYETREDIRYVKYIGFAFEKVRNKLKNYPEFSKLFSILMKVYYEN